jgi:hypothetical protein
LKKVFFWKKDKKGAILYLEEKENFSREENHL